MRDDVALIDAEWRYKNTPKYAKHYKNTKIIEIIILSDLPSMKNLPEIYEQTLSGKSAVFNSIIFRKKLSDLKSKIATLVASVQDKSLEKISKAAHNVHESAESLQQLVADAGISYELEVFNGIIRECLALEQQAGINRQGPVDLQRASSPVLHLWMQPPKPVKPTELAPRAGSETVQP